MKDAILRSARARHASRAPRTPAPWLAHLARAVATCLLLYGFDADADAAAPVIDAHYSLSTAEGARVTERSYQGKWQLIYFGFASCTDVCSLVMQEVAGAMHDLGADAAQIQPLFITLDPANDTPGRLSEYLARFDRRIVGLHGSMRQTRDATSAFRMYFKTRTPASGAETIDHSSFLFLLKPDGSFASLLPGNTAGHALASELRRHLE